MTGENNYQLNKAKKQKIPTDETRDITKSLSL